MGFVGEGVGVSGSPVFLLSAAGRLRNCGLILILLADVLSGTSPSDYYRYQIIAKAGQVVPGQTALTGIGDSPSVNAAGVVAFIGQFSGGEGVVTGDGINPLVLVSPGRVSSNIFFGRAVQIADTGQIIATDRAVGSPPLYWVRRWDAKNPGSDMIFATSNVAFPQFDAIFTFGSTSNNNKVTFGGLQHNSSNTLLASGTTSPFFCCNTIVVPTNSLLRPMIADDGRITVKFGNAPADPIRLYSFDLSTFTTIADSIDFVQTGNYPGISEDGQIVTFYGDVTASGAVKYGVGKGVFASVDVGTSVRKIVRIAGVSPGGFTNFIDARIGVNGTQAIQRSVTVVYRAADATGEGIYSSRLSLFGDGTAPFDPTKPALILAGTPTVVVKVGDTIPGLNGAIQSLSLSDPVNSRDRGDIAFWVSTNDLVERQAVVRARPQQVVFLDFNPADPTHFRPGNEPAAVTLMRGQGITLSWANGLAGFIASSGRADLNASAIQSAVVGLVQAAFDTLDPLNPGAGVNVKVTDVQPVGGPYVHAFIGDGPNGPNYKCLGTGSGADPGSCFLFGIAPAIDLFNQGFEIEPLYCPASQGGLCDYTGNGVQGLFDFGRKTPLIFLDNIFRAADVFKLGPYAGKPIGVFTDGASHAIDLSWVGPNRILQSDVENAISTIVTHEVGHTLGLRHLDNQAATDPFTMKANPDLFSDTLRNSKQFYNAAKPLSVGEGFSSTDLENSGARLAFSVGSDRSNAILSRDAPGPKVIVDGSRSNLSIGTLIAPGSVNVAKAFVGIVPHGTVDSFPALVDLGSGDLGTLLKRTLSVTPLDKMIILASTTGGGFDIFSVRGGGDINVAAIDVSDSLFALTDHNLQIELFDPTGSPLPAPPTDLYRIVGSTPVRIGGSSSIAVTSIIGVLPHSAQPGQTLTNVVITGQSTNFISGTTVASFGPGITVNTLTVSSLTTATANVTIAGGAALGGRTVSLTTGTTVASLANGFTVTQGTPTIASVTPNTGQQGQTLASVAIVGQSTNFVQGTTVASLGPGVTVNNLVVNGPTSAAISITIASDAILGPRSVTLTTGTDVASISNGFTVNLAAPVLAVAKTHGGSFVQGLNATYSVVVSNSASAGPTNGMVTVTDTIPAGLTLVSMTGTGWSCAANACTRSDTVNGGSSYPPITVTVNVAGNAPASVTNTVTASGGGSPNASASDPTTITAPPAALAITKTHNGSFTQGQNGATFTLTISNAVSAGPTNGVVSVTDAIPTGLTLVGMSGAGWSCTGNACARSDVLSSGSSFAPITVTVNVAGNAPATVTNTATVSGGGSTASSASDPTTVGAAQIVWLGGGHAGGINRVVAATSGNIWTAGNDRTIKQWRQSDMTLLRTVQIDYTSAAAAISRDGQRAAAVGSAGPAVFQLPAGTLVRTYQGGGWGTFAPMLSADGQKILYEQFNPTIDALIFGSNTDGTVRTIATTGFGFEFYWLSPNGNTAVLRGGVAGELNLYRTSDATLIRTLGGNPGVGASTIAFSADNTLMAVGAGADSSGRVVIWRLTDFLIVQSITVRRTDGSTPNLTSIAFSPDGQLFATGDDQAARVWRVVDGTPVVTIPGGVSQLDFSADGNSLVVAGSDSALRLWSIPSGAPSLYPPGQTAAITAVAYSPTGSLVASSSGDQTIKIRNATDGKVVATLTGHSGAVNSIAFSPSGSQLVSGGSDNKVILWDMNTFSQVRTLSGHTSVVRGVAFSPDGSSVASGSDAPEQVVKLWTVASGANTRTLIGSAAGVTSVAYSPDGLTVAAGSQAGVGRLWNVNTGVVARSYLAASQGVMSIAFSPDGQKLATGWTSKILIFDAAQGTLLQTIDAHAKDGTVVAYAPDGLRILSGNPDGSVKTWNTSTGALVSNQTLETFANGSGVTSVGYSRDNTRFVYGRGDATIVLALTGSTPINPLYTVTTNPSGLSIAVDGSTLAAPQTFNNWASGSSHTIGVLSPQGNYAFSNWSDGGAQSHSLIAPGFSTTYTANFIPCSYSIAPLGQAFSAAGGTGTVNVTAATGCPWTAVSGATWIHVTGGATGSGNGQVSYSVDANATAGQRVNAATTFVIAGTDFTVTQSAPAGNQAPTVASLTPAVSTGASQSYVFQFGDPDGSQDLNVLNVLINNALDGRQACYLAYVRQSNTLFLVDDAGDAGGPYAGSLVLNGSGSVGNSQCTVNGVGSSAVGSGNTLTLTLSMSFSSAFGGNKVVYLAARDAAQNNTGWQTMGVHGVPPLPASFPTPVSMNPPSGSTANSTLTFAFQDASTASNLQTGWALINTAIDGRGSCYVAYYRPGNQVYLYPDNGDGAQATSMVVTGTNTVSNSQCTVSAQGSSITTNGAILTVNLNISFKPAFTGPKGVWMAVQTMGGAQTSPWQALGAWRVP